MSTRPTRARTWAPRGQTPVLHETFNWKSLSIIGGLALWRFYFQIHAGSIKSLQVIEFLQHLQRHIPGKILILWDGAPIHRSLLVKNHVAATRRRVIVERLPAYAPELNPVEYIWTCSTPNERSWKPSPKPSRFTRYNWFPPCISSRLWAAALSKIPH